MKTNESFSSSRLLEKAGFEILEKIPSESRLHETGARRLIMHCIFHIGRLLHMRDRIIVIARKALGRDRG